MIEGRFMLAELEHAPKIGVRGDVYSPQIRKTGKPLLVPFSSPSCRYHERYYDGFSRNYYLAKSLLLLVGANRLCSF